MLNAPLRRVSPPQSSPVQEAIRNHVDRLQFNKTRSEFSHAPAPSPYVNSHPVYPASKGQIRYGRQHPTQTHDGTFFAPAQARQAHAMLKRNAPLTNIGNHIEGFLGLKQLGQQVVGSADPRTRAGLVSDLAMLVPGPKDAPMGDASAMMGELGMPGQFRSYDGTAPVNPLDRGIANEGPNPGRQGAGIRGLTRRAQGRTYQPSRATPLDALKNVQMEHRLAQQKAITDRWGSPETRATSNDIKEFSNRRGFAMKDLHSRAHNEYAMQQALGAKLIPYRPKPGEEPFMDTQSHDFTDRNALLGLHELMPGNSLLGNKNPIEQAIYDMLFRQGHFMGPKPRRP